MSSIQFAGSSSSFPVEADILDVDFDIASIGSISESNERYALLPLSQEAREIRLLELLPSRSLEAPIECKLFKVSRLDGPIFSALSYTWGTKRHEVPISVNGKDWYVTENLFMALFHLRSREVPLVLWVDAICVDQHNDDEKSWHVRQMRQIFMEAENSLLWLGTGSPDTSAALEMLSSIGDKAAALGSPAEIWGDAVSSKIVSLLQEASEQDRRTSHSNDESLSTLMQDIIRRNEKSYHFPEPATLDILGRPWWSRVWVLQEVAVSKRACVVCGFARVAFSSINISAALYYQYMTSLWSSDVPNSPREALFSPNALLMQALYAQLTIRWAYLNYYLEPGIPLVFLLSSVFAYGSTRVLQTSDPRDYIFALLGLSCDAGAMDIVADYSMSNTSVYIHLAWNLIRNQHFIVLSWCRSKKRKAPSYLPSWVPDFTCKIHRPFQWVQYSPETNNFVLKPQYDASRGLVGSTMEFFPSPSAQVLRMFGVVLDCVTHSWSSWEELYERQIQRPQLRDCVSVRWLKEAKMSFDESTGTSKVNGSTNPAEMVWKTSAAGMVITPSWERIRSPAGILPLQQSLYDEGFPSEKMVGSPDLQQHFDLMEITNLGRRPFMSKLGRIGLGPTELRPGDRVVVFCGIQMPFIARSAAGGRWRLVGDAYVYGIMDGLQDVERCKVEAIDIV